MTADCELRAFTFDLSIGKMCLITMLLIVDVKE